MQRFHLSRRQLLKAVATTSAAAALATATRTIAADKELVWATWDSNSRNEFLAPFEKASGVNIKVSYIESEDSQFAAMKTGAAKDWDVVNPSLSGVKRYAKSGLLQPIDLSRLPNRSLLYSPFANPKETIGAGGHVFGVPYVWGLNPIVYRADKIDGEADYSTLFDPRYKGQLAMADDALQSIAIAALHIGIPRERVFNLSTAELAEAKEALIAQKPLLRTYWLTIGDLTNLFATGEVSCAFSWRDPYDKLRDRMKLAMAEPKAGTMGWCDCFALPTDLPAEKVDIAYQFMNYLLGADYARSVAELANYASSTSVVRDQLSEDKRKAIFVDDLAVMDSFLWPVAPDNYAEWLKVWNQVKAA